MDTIMDMGNVIIGDIIPRVDNGINGIIPQIRNYAHNMI